MGFDATLMCLLQIGETLNKVEGTYDVLDIINLQTILEHLDTLS